MTSRAARPDQHERADPVVTYSRLPAEDFDGRHEPRMSAIADARALRADDIIDIEVLPQVAAPSSDLAFDDLEAPVRPRGRRRRGGSRLALVVGAFAILAGAGVLAATFSGVVTGNGAAPVAAVEGDAVASLEGGAAPDASSGDVRVIASFNPDGVAANPVTPAVGPASVAAERVVAPPPMPRLRPTMATPGVAEPAPLTTAAASRDAGFVPREGGFVAPAPVAAAPAQSVDDPQFQQVMASVDEILANQRNDAIANPGVANPGVAGAALNGTVQSGVSMRGELFGPPPPPPLGGVAMDLGVPAPPASGVGGLLPQRGVFMPSGPVPPADIPFN